MTNYEIQGVSQPPKGFIRLVIEIGPSGVLCGQWDNGGKDLNRFVLNCAEVCRFSLAKTLEEYTKQLDGITTTNNPGLVPPENN